MTASLRFIEDFESKMKRSAKDVISLKGPIFTDGYGTIILFSDLIPLGERVAAHSSCYTYVFGII